MSSTYLVWSPMLHLPSPTFQTSKAGGGWWSRGDRTQILLQKVGTQLWSQDMVILHQVLELTSKWINLVRWGILPSSIPRYWGIIWKSCTYYEVEEVMSDTLALRCTMTKTLTQPSTYWRCTVCQHPNHDGERLILNFIAIGIFDFG